VQAVPLFNEGVPMGGRRRHRCPMGGRRHRRCRPFHAGPLSCLVGVGLDLVSAIGRMLFRGVRRWMSWVGFDAAPFTQVHKAALSMLVSTQLPCTQTLMGARRGFLCTQSLMDACRRFPE